MYFSKQEIGQTKLSIMWSILWSKLMVLTGMLVLALSLFNGQALPVEAAVFKENLALPEKPVMITFDDGYESNYTLAYPYGAYNAATEKIAQELGYLITLSTRAGFVKSGDTGLKRININGNDDLLTFQSKLLVNAN